MPGPWEQYQPTEQPDGPWKRYGTEGQPPVTGIQPMGYTAPRSAADEFLKQAAIPTVTSAVGTVAGTALLGPIAGPLVGESLGSGAGEALNQYLGITPRSNTALGLSLGLPPLMRGVAAGIQRLPRLLPGASAALQEQAALEARALPNAAIAVPEPSAQLFDALKRSANKPSGKMPFPKTLGAVQKLTQEELGSLAGLQDVPLIERLTKMEGGLTQGLTFDEFDKTIRSLGRKIGATQDDALRGSYKLIYKNLLQDVETMAPPVGVPLDVWKQARNMYRKEMAQTEFAQMIESKGIKKVGDLLDQVNPNAIANWIKDPKQEFWRKSLDQNELEQINRALKDWAKIPTVPVRRGAPIGSGRKIGEVGAGGAIGGYLGGPAGAAIGMIAADKGSEYIAQALTSDTGRKALIGILRASDGKFGQAQAGLLGAFLAGGLGSQMAATKSVASPVAAMPSLPSTGIPTPSQEALQEPTFSPLDAYGRGKRP